jgi:hypothetical protein
MNDTYGMYNPAYMTSSNVNDIHYYNVYPHLYGYDGKVTDDI